MNFTELDFSEYNKIRKLLLVGSEENKDKVYRDSKNIATIGIGINIGQLELKGLWLRLILYYLFDLVKSVDDIEFVRFDSLDSLKNVIKDTQSYKYKEFQTFIATLANTILNTLQTDIKTSTINTNIQDLIKDYLNHTKTLTIEQRQRRLTELDLKVTKNNKGESQYIEFKLKKEQAEALFDIMAINYEAKALEHFNNRIFTNKKQFYHFNKIKEKDKNNRKYYKEFIPFVSATYQSPNIIKNNDLITKKAFEFQSRFLLWAIIRYKLDGDIRRRILQSAIFNFNNKKDKEIETDDEKFNTCISIFKTLNLLNISHKKQTYLEYFEKIEKTKVKINKDKYQTISDFIKEEANAYKNSSLLKYKTNPNYAIYRSTYINPSELKPLKDILNPYAQYLDSLIPQAHFENSADFTRFALESTQSTTKSANKDFTQAKQYRFKLHNIYFIDNTNYNEVRAALQSRANQTDTNPKNSTPKQNILIIITETLQEQICLTKPKDCYLFVVCAKGNEIDCSFCNDVLLDSTPQNDECELFMLEGLESNKPKITPLHSNNAIELISDSKDRFSGKQDTFTYNMDKHNCLCITQNDEVIIRLANYRFFITQDNNEKYG